MCDNTQCKYCLFYMGDSTVNENYNINSTINKNCNGKCHIPLLKYISYEYKGYGYNTLKNIYNNIDEILDGLPIRIAKNNFKIVVYTNSDKSIFYYVDFDPLELEVVSTTYNSPAEEEKDKKNKVINDTIWSQFRVKVKENLYIDKNINDFVYEICYPFYVEVDCIHNYFNGLGKCELYSELGAFDEDYRNTFKDIIEDDEFGPINEKSEEELIPHSQGIHQTIAF